MATATSAFMRRHSRFPTGIETGCGDTSFAKCPQPTLMCVELTDSNYKEVVFPAGTLLIAGVMAPRPPGAGDGFVAATAGDIKINKITGGEGGSVSTEYFAAAPVEAYVRTVLASGAGIQLASETRVRFTASVALEPATTGVGRIGLEVILPPTRI